jgi:CRP-like cAMP-binding protein
MAKFKTTSIPGRHDSLEPLRTHFPTGSVIFSEGDLGLAMYVVEAGEVEIRKKFGGDDQVLAVLGKGDFFGEMCMLDGVTDGPKAPADPSARLIELASGMIFPLSEKRETTVGRIDPVTGIHPDVDLTPIDGKRSISRRHARVRREEDGTFSVIEDVGTMNGTFVNGVRLTVGRPFPVQSGDLVVFGPVQCRFEVDTAEA